MAEENYEHNASEEKGWSRTCGHSAAEHVENCVCYCNAELCPIRLGYSEGIYKWLYGKCLNCGQNMHLCLVEYERDEIENVIELKNECGVCNGDRHCFKMSRMIEFFNDIIDENIYVFDLNAAMVAFNGATASGKSTVKAKNIALNAGRKE